MPKATSSFNLGDTWQQVASGGQSVLLQALDGDQVYIAYSTSVPAVGSDGHSIPPRKVWGDAAVANKLWARAVGGNAMLIATVGGTAIGTATAQTTSYELRSTWTQIAAASKRVRLYCPTGAPALFAYAATIPSGNLSHKLSPSDTFEDDLSDQIIWARSESDRYLEPTRLVVTVG